MRPRLSYCCREVVVQKGFLGLVISTSGNRILLLSLKSDTWEIMHQGLTKRNFRLYHLLSGDRNCRISPSHLFSPHLPIQLFAPCIYKPSVLLLLFEKRPHKRKAMELDPYRPPDDARLPQAVHEPPHEVRDPPNRGAPHHAGPGAAADGRPAGHRQAARSRGSPAQVRRQNSGVGGDAEGADGEDVLRAVRARPAPHIRGGRANARIGGGSSWLRCGTHPAGLGDGKVEGSETETCLGLFDWVSAAVKVIVAATSCWKSNGQNKKIGAIKTRFIKIRRSAKDTQK